MTTKNLALAASITMLVAISGLASARAAGSYTRDWPEATGSSDQQVRHAFNAVYPPMATQLETPSSEIAPCHNAIGTQDDARRLGGNGHRWCLTHFPPYPWPARASLVFAGDVRLSLAALRADAGNSNRGEP
jgi:hypothetical protein